MHDDEREAARYAAAGVGGPMLALFCPMHEAREPVKSPAALRSDLARALVRAADAEARERLQQGRAADAEAQARDALRRLHEVEAAGRRAAHAFARRAFVYGAAVAVALRAVLSALGILP